LAPRHGFEPRFTAPKASVLPLDNQGSTPTYALYDDGTFVNQAHNDWAEWAVDGGLPLFLMFGAIAVLLLRPAFRSVWGIGLISVLAHCCVDFPLQQKAALAAWFFVFLGALAASSKFSAVYPSMRSSRQAMARGSQPAGAL
jgi:O-antigen ligase